MLLESMSELVEADWHWDFVINLSESDFPVKLVLFSVLKPSSNKLIITKINTMNCYYLASIFDWAFK